MNIADESSDDEGFEVDENDNENDQKTGNLEEDAEDRDAPNDYSGNRSSSSSSSSSSSNIPRTKEGSAVEGEEEEEEDEEEEGVSEGNDSIDRFAQARKVPLSHQVSFRL